jgi:uncharacterized membrane protein YqjE
MRAPIYTALITVAHMSISALVKMALYPNMRCSVAIAGLNASVMLCTLGKLTLEYKP